MKKYALIAVAASFGVPAFAGGLTEAAPEPVIAPVEQTVFNAGRDWSGAYVGAQLGYGDIDSNGAGLDGDDVLGGLHLGYRRDFGQFVGAVELDHDFANIDLDAPNSELESVTRLKLIAGADLGQTLVYGTVGAAYAEANVGGTSLNDTGYFIGVGADYALSDQWSVGGEYLYHQFDDFDNSGVDLDVQTLKAKVSFSF